MSDHVAVFNEGKIEQVGSPNEVYEHPATEFVAGFVGTSNILERDGKRFSVRPERIELNGTGEAGVVADVTFVGAFTRILVDTDAGDRLTVVRQNDGSSVTPGAIFCAAVASISSGPRFSSGGRTFRSSRASFSSIPCRTDSAMACSSPVYGLRIKATES